MALHRGDHRLSHVPGHQLEREAAAQALVEFERVVAPGLVAAAAEIVARAEAASRPAQHHHAGGGVLVGLRERDAKLAPHVHAERIELVGPVERDEADLAVGVVEDELFSHCLSSSPQRHARESGHPVRRVGAVKTQCLFQTSGITGSPAFAGDDGEVHEANYDATHWVKRSSMPTMRSASQWSSSLTEMAWLAGQVGSCTAMSCGIISNAPGLIGP